MRTKKVLLDYSDFKDDELNTLAGKVLDCMENHTTFIDLPIDLEVVETQVEDFRAKWQIASRGGSLLQIAEKNDAKEVLAESFKQIAFYVNNVAAGKRSLLLSSGLQLEADPVPSTVPDAIQGVGLVDGRQRNQMGVLFDPLKGTRYIYEYEVADELDEQGQPIWNHYFQTGSSRNNVFAPTVPDRIYYLRVRARNNKGIGDWSEVVSLKAR